MSLDTLTISEKRAVNKLRPVFITETNLKGRGKNIPLPNSIMLAESNLRLIIRQEIRRKLIEEGFFDKVKSFAKGSKEAISKKAGELAASGKDALKKGKEAISKKVSSVIEVIKKQVESKIQDFGKSLSNKSKELSDKISNIQGVIEKAKSVKEEMEKSLGQKLEDYPAVKDLLKKFKEAAKCIPETFKLFGLIGGKKEEHGKKHESRNYINAIQINEAFEKYRKTSRLQLLNFDAKNLIYEQKLLTEELTLAGIFATIVGSWAAVIFYLSVTVFIHKVIAKFLEFMVLAYEKIGEIGEIKDRSDIEKLEEMIERVEHCEHAWHQVEEEVVGAPFANIGRLQYAGYKVYLKFTQAKIGAKEIIKGEEGQEGRSKLRTAIDVAKGVHSGQLMKKGADKLIKGDEEEEGIPGEDLDASITYEDFMKNNKAQKIGKKIVTAVTFIALLATYLVKLGSQLMEFMDGFSGNAKNLVSTLFGAFTKASGASGAAPAATKFVKKGAKVLGAVAKSA